MKKLILILTTLCLLMSTAIISNGTTRNLPITLYVNNQFAYSEALPVSLNNTFYIPIRTLSDIADLEVQWDEATQSITLTKGSKTIELAIDYTKVFVDGFEFKMNAAPALIDGRAYVPIDFISDNFNFTYRYEASTASLYLTGGTIEAAWAARSYTAEDVVWLARIIQVEAGGSSLKGKLGVANVVINRKYSGRFANTISGVIFAPGQFPPTQQPGFSSMTPNAECVYAAKLALNGSNTVGESLYFNHVPFASKADDFYAKIDGQYFYY